MQFNKYFIMRFYRGTIAEWHQALLVICLVEFFHNKSTNKILNKHPITIIEHGTSEELRVTKQTM